MHLKKCVVLFLFLKSSGAYGVVPAWFAKGAARIWANKMDLLSLYNAGLSTASTVVAFVPSLRGEDESTRVQVELLKAQRDQFNFSNFLQCLQFLQQRYTWFKQPSLSQAESFVRAGQYAAKHNKQTYPGIS